MSIKQVPFSFQRIAEIAKTTPTPFYLYDAEGLRRGARDFLSAFGIFDGFKEFFAVKATPNPAILRLLHAEGLGADCSSLAELVLAERCGFGGNDIMFTSNNTPAAEYRKAIELGAVINLDDIGHLAYLEEHVGMPQRLCFRYNPGPLRSGNTIIGNPVESKFGLTRDQLFEGYQLARRMGVTRFGIHTMVASNELDPHYVVATARMLFELAGELFRQIGIRLEFVNIGGGIGIPYRPDEAPIDLDALARSIRQAYQDLVIARGLSPLRLYTECGRAITGPHGYLVTRVLHLKETYKRYAGLDATMANLMRPGMYGAYHHVTVLGKEEWPADQRYDLVGSLCENNDKFAIDRCLPRIEVGDLVVIHDVGAHGHAMGFNYNGKLRSAELLIEADDRVRLIRRAETLDDYFATLDFPGSDMQ